MNKGKTFLLVSTALVGLSLAGCGWQQVPHARPSRLAHVVHENQDGKEKGIVLAESAMVAMEKHATAGLQQDCDGPAMAVTSGNVSGSEQYVFGADGTPCKRSEVLFNGENPKDTRPPVPSIQIAFQDELGSRPSTAENMPKPYDPIMGALPTDGKTMVDFAQEGTGSLPQITHTSVHTGLDVAEKAKRWQVMGDAEKLMADLRQVDRLSASQIIAAHQDKVLDLKARVRELEKEKATLQTAKLDKQLTADELRQQMRMLERERLEQEDILTNERDELKRRLGMFERKNQEMAFRNAEREKALTSKLAVMEQSVAVGEKQAEAARQELILEAAQKIAEAERLAFAARMAEKEAVAQEAARKRAEGDILLQRAMSLQEGQTVLVPGLADQLGDFQKVNPIPVPLEEMPLALHVENVSLQKLLEEVLSQVKKHAGDWRASWQLNPQNQYILQETWSLTAEATVGEVLNFIQTRLQETHNIKIEFERFDKVKLLVATDGGDVAVQPHLQK